MSIHRRYFRAVNDTLAAIINVTDKAVSRWERGIGFPDISTLEPLAAALGISVPELMKSERIAADNVTKEEVTDLISDTLQAAKLQRREERKNLLSVFWFTLVTVIIILFLDRIHWQADILLFEGFGVVLPLFCIIGFIVLLGRGIQRKRTGKPWGLSLTMALIFLLLLLMMVIVLFLIGALGIGPVPT